MSENFQLLVFSSLTMLQGIEDCESKYMEKLACSHI